MIDDDAELLQALAFLLRTAGFVVETYDDAESFLRQRSAVTEGCIITDVRMPGMSGIELLRQLRDENDQTPTIVLTAHGDIALAVEAMKAGAADFIEKPFDYDILLGAITAALQRNRAGVTDVQISAEVRQRLQFLSERERQVLEGLVAGKSNKVIAYDLRLSARTIEGYRASVMAKMQVRTLSALIRMMLVGTMES